MHVWAKLQDSWVNNTIWRYMINISDAYIEYVCMYAIHYQSISKQIKVGEAVCQFLNDASTITFQLKLDWYCVLDANKHRMITAWEELVQDLLQHICHSIDFRTCWSHLGNWVEIAHRATFATWEWRRGMHILLTQPWEITQTGTAEGGHDSLATCSPPPKIMTIMGQWKIDPKTRD